MSDEELDDAIRHGVKRALAYGIGTERDAAKFVSLTFVLGRDFDRDPRLPWAREILDGARVHRGMSTIDLLVQEALRHDSSVRGAHVARAL